MTTRLIFGKKYVFLERSKILDSYRINSSICLFFNHVIFQEITVVHINQMNY